MKQIHPQVLHFGRTFRAIGMSTPAITAHKCDLFLRPNFEGERVGVVMVDAIRCLTTLLAVLAAGARGITVTTKYGERGTTLRQAQGVADILAADVCLGGELHGKPIRHGLIGNSPRDARTESLGGKLVHFHSTNFGSAFAEVITRVPAFHDAGGLAETYVGSFANLRALVTEIQAEQFDRLFIAAGGFYDCLSLEDLIVGGDILLLLGVPPGEMDDEARLMWISARQMVSPEKRVVAFQTNWIGRCLAYFGMESDIADVVGGQGIALHIWERMQRLVPIVQFVAGVPVILPAVTRNKEEKSSFPTINMQRSKFTEEASK